jgi:exonuclease SbcC
MIPLRLHVRNFLSYGPTTQIVNFSPYHLICLTGKNGHGKSALLDALTWALWGQARKTTGTSKADEGLLHLGQTSMTVALDLASGHYTYRIKREFSSYQGKQQSSLEFGIVDEQGLIRPLTEKTIRATQDKITTILGLSFESFINTVYLRQGGSNEFSKKSPKERKQILTEILELNHFEEAKQLALNEQKQLISHHDYLVKLRAHLEQECSMLPEIEQRLSACQTKLRLLHGTGKEKALLLHTVQTDTLTAQTKSLELQSLLQTTAKHQADYSMLWQELRSSRQRMQQIRHEQKAYNRRSLEQEKQSLENYKQELELQRSQLLAAAATLLEKQRLLETIRHACAEHRFKQEQSYQIALQRLTSRLQEQQRAAAQLHNQKAALEMAYVKSEQELHQVQILAYETNKALHHLTQRSAHIATALSNADRCTARSAALRQEHTTLTQALQLLVSCSSSRSEHTCPTCTQPLPPRTAAVLTATYTQRLGILARALQRLAALASAYAALKDEQQAIELQIADSKAKNAQHSAQVTQLTTVHQEQAAQLTVLSAQQHQLEAEAATLEQQLASHQAAAQNTMHCGEHQAKEQALIIAIQELEKTVKSAPSIEVYQATTTRLYEIKSLLEKNIQLYEQQNSRERLHLQSLIHTARQVRDQLQAAAPYQEAYNKALHEYQVYHQQAEALARELELLRTQREEQMIEEGKLKNHYELLQEKQNQKREIEQSLISVQNQLETYQTVIGALGKDGIQALMIEEALPEIEHEANQLLAKLTDNQAYVRFESLRDLKSGGTRETLDITISDARGTRPYEMFSGGEAFRIDFALRIAIAKLLARQSGTALQTLIIDEGFGSQDEDGLALILDALHKIQDAFAKIIIVSHLPWMKEQFPVHFIVHKGLQGSSIRVIEND